VKGKLCIDNYGILAAVQLDPIEKKPFNHFMPGSYTLGIGTSSCNFGCLFCQNHSISKEHEVIGKYFPPRRVVELAVESGASSIAYTYNEPAIFMEYALKVAKMAHMKGLCNVIVTNGYLTGEAIDSMDGLIDAAVVNLKGNGEEKFVNKYQAIPSIEPIKEAMLAMKEAGIHLEITDMVVPEVGDSLKACDSVTRWVRRELDAETPIQFITFYPDYKMIDYPTTSYDSLKAHYDTARKNGLLYAYVGNLTGNPYEDTYCPSCGSVAIDREGFEIVGWNLDDGMRCRKCGYKMPIVMCKQNALETRKAAGR